MGKNNDIIQSYCKKIYLIGSGNFWFVEGEVVGDDRRWFYRLYTFILISIYVITTLLEILAVLFGEYPEDEMGDAVTFAVSHSIVVTKIISVIMNKNLIRNINKNMIESCEKYEESNLMERMYKILKINILAYFIVVYGACVCYVFEGFRRLSEGSHFVTVVTYYPTHEDNSLMATVFRIFATLVLYVMMMSMIVSVDSYTMTNLIMLKYKFITLRHYFEKLREEFDKTSITGNLQQATEKLTNGLVEGIVMHNQLLMLGKDIHTAFGMVISLQLLLSSGSAVSLLLQIALSDEITFVASMKVIFFVAALFFLLGLFLCNAGEITYQASLLSNAIFYCGWYLSPVLPSRQRNLRQIVLRACMQTQHPPVMKAFKMIELTYATFLQVLRGTYSVFALFYARRK
ncbi:uncharacterized protein LOC113513273 [Galleria mellonella]|uniref:Odorant receptor n=1 Tax=Galleria mellonella TaxID=7137 RepID=A0ABM3MLL1_GALME|nr:uncharacterized protein LOC113513273 [Galleria mellonella]